MRKLLAAGLILLLGLPPLLSLTASYYLQNHFLESIADDNIAANLQFRRFDYKHGWFNSNADIDFYLGKHNIVIRTNNSISHGPVIWSLLSDKPLEAFSLYQIHSQVEIPEHAAWATQNSQKATATTSVSYTGSFKPEIQHPGLALRLFNSQIFADLPKLNSEFLTQGAVVSNFSANQLDIQDRAGGIYAIQPGVEITLNTYMTLPSQLQVRASNLYGRYGPDEFSAEPFALVSHLEKKANLYHLSIEASAELLGLNEADVDQITLKLLISDLDEDLITYLYANHTALSSALQNNQWLVLLKHFSQAMKRLGDHQPQLKLLASGLYANRPVRLDLFGKLVADQQLQLNPFSVLDKLEIKFDADIPARLLNEANLPDLIYFLNLMSDKGLLILKNQSYHSKLSFKNAKLKISHDIL